MNLSRPQVFLSNHQPFLSNHQAFLNSHQTPRTKPTTMADTPTTMKRPILYKRLSTRATGFGVTRSKASSIGFSTRSRMRPAVSLVFFHPSDAASFTVAHRPGSLLVFATAAVRLRLLSSHITSAVTQV